MSEEASASAVARLYLVENKQGAVLLAFLGEGFKEFGGGFMNPGNTLYSFYNRGGIFPGGQCFRSGIYIIERNEIHIGRDIEWSAD